MQQQQATRTSIGCESVHSMSESFHVSPENHPENSTRFDFDYNTSNETTEEDELLDVIAKWQEN